MRLIKNAPKTYYAFIFPSDEGIDWKATAREVIEKVTLFRSMYKDGLEANGHTTLTDEQITQMFIDNANPSSIYQGYVLANFDCDLIKGNHTVFIFDEVNTTDINNLSNLTPKIKGLKNKNITQLNIIDFLGNEENFNQVKDVIKELFTLKLVAVQYDDSIKKEDQLSKEEVIKALFEDQGLTIQDVSQLQKFVSYTLKNMIIKKKSLPPIVG